MKTMTLCSSAEGMLGGTGKLPVANIEAAAIMANAESRPNPQRQGGDDQRRHARPGAHAQQTHQREGGPRGQRKVDERQEEHHRFVHRRGRQAGSTALRKAGGR